MIIIKSNILMKPEELDYHHRRILNQRDEGVILLPAYFDVIAMPDEDVVVVRDLEGREYKIYDRKSTEGR